MAELRTRHLPAWPFLLLFGGFPVWWVLGLGSFAPQICAIPMVVLMAMRGGIRFPRAYWLWFAFLLCALTSSVMLDGFGRTVGYAVRVSNFIAGAVVFLYVFNSARDRLDDRRVMAPIVVFFTTIVVGGWLGVLVPQGRIETITSKILPASIASNSYVDNLVRPPFAEVQTPYGSPITFNRPSAPFAYTNGWGVNYTLMVFFAFAMIVLFRSLWAKACVAGLLLLSVVPAFATGNRGMMLAIGIFTVYGVARLALRGRNGPLITLLTAGGLGVVILGPFVLGAIESRLAYSDSNNTRTGIYQEAFQGALQAPLLGNGSPKPSTTGLTVSVGTQGQLWNVMYSYGFLALALFVGWLAAAAWLSRHARGTARLWLHVATCVPLLTIVYYGFDGMQLIVAMTAAAVALRPYAPDRAAAPSVRKPLDQPALATG